MKKFYYFISMILLGLILTSYVKAGDENPGRIMGETDWYDYMRTSIGDYTYVDCFRNDGFGEYQVEWGIKQEIDRITQSNGHECVHETLYRNGLKFRDNYFYTDETGAYSSSNSFLIDLSYSPCEFIPQDYWLKTIDFNNDNWVMVEKNFDADHLGSNIYFTGTFKMTAKKSGDTSIKVGSESIPSRTIIYYLIIDGKFNKGTDTVNMKNFTHTMTSYVGKFAGPIAFKADIPKHNNPWFFEKGTIYRSNSTSYSRNVLSVDDIDLLSNINIYPNPFSQSTTINYELPLAGYVSLVIYDMLGNEATVLVDGWKEAGSHEARFDGSGLSAGMYFYVLRAGERVESGKVLKIE